MIFEQIRHVHIEKNDMFQNITKLIYHICQVRDEIMIYIYIYIHIHIQYIMNVASITQLYTKY